VKRAVLCIISCLYALAANAQLVADATYTGQQLTDLIVGDGITVSNVVLTCPNGGSAYFDGSATNLGMATGVLLTSGTVANAISANNDAGSSACNGAPGDPQVEGVAGETTYDACILEFDMVPTCSQFTFTYIFASDEYPEYINEEFADAMVITISGPGFVGQQNLALIPGTATGVGITTVNSSSYNQYYVSNNGGSFQYDGFTVPLTATANVTSCQSYHIKIAVADAADCIFDSGLFIAENSLDCGVNNSVTTDITIGPFQPIEGCRDYDIELCRQGDTSNPYNLNLSYAGTATNGVDYTMLPAVLNFPAGVQCQTLTVSPIEDGIFEGAEEILFVYEAASGACNVNDTVSIQIIDDQNMVPDFYYNDVCDGSTVFFNNGTSISPPATVTDFVWKFGDGNQVNQYNSSHLYATAGNYDVWLVATSNDNCLDSVMYTVNVYDYPEADFSFTDICLNSPASFTNLSTASTNDVFGEVIWNFGDGASANSWDAIHNYSIPDSFFVSLTVYTDILSCSDTKLDTIVVYPPIQSEFAAANVCFGDTVFLFNQSVGTGIWEWDFDDGNNYQAIDDTTHYFAAAGIYDVRLVGISPNGCNDTAFVEVTVYDAPVAGFTTSDICANELAQFVNTTTLPNYGALGSWYWLFSDGTNSSAYSPLHVFPTAGQYTATLIVYNEFLGCSDTTTASIELFPVPQSDFTVENVCFGEIVAPDNLSLNSASFWSWSFGDATGTVLQASPTHNYLQPGTYDVMMVATYVDQCSDTAIHPVIVYDLPVADFSSYIVCEGQTTPFLNHSTIPFPENIIQWIWDYGDGSALDTVFNGAHVYPDGGNYDVELFITSGHGCTGQTTGQAWVNYAPNISLYTSEPSGCPIHCVDFIDNSSIPFGEIVDRKWNLGDFQFSHEQALTHCYNNAAYDESAFYNIRFDVESDSGCTTTRILDSLIEVFPVTYAGFDWTPDSVSTFDPTVQFIDESYGANSWDWDFGDTNQYSLSSLQNPDFTYSEHGYHNIQLITDNDHGCSDTTLRTIYIYADLRFYVPNAFTPDRDGKNEGFQGYGSDINEYNMKIFNRWGGLIFESNDIDYSWDGTVNGTPAKAGIYIYEFQIKDLNDNPHEYTGHFTLLR